MKRFLGALVVTALLSGQGSTARADEKDATPILDKAIAALGGEEKLAKAATATWKGKGTITFNEAENSIKTQTTVQGIDRHRAEFEGEFNGNEVKGVTVLNGDKGWRKFGEEPMEMDDERLANEKRNVSLEVLPVTLVALKGSGYKLEAADEQSVDGKPAVGIKVTGPDQKDFTLYFDKDSGLPVKMVAKVVGFQGNEHTQETTFKDYKDFDGIKKATKVESKRDGEDFRKEEVSEFKVLDKVEDKTFSEPS